MENLFLLLWFSSLPSGRRYWSTGNCVCWKSPAISADVYPHAASPLSLLHSGCLLSEVRCACNWDKFPSALHTGARDGVSLPCLAPSHPSSPHRVSCCKHPLSSRKPSFLPEVSSLLQNPTGSCLKYNSPRENKVLRGGGGSQPSPGANHHADSGQPRVTKEGKGLKMLSSGTKSRLHHPGFLSSGDQREKDPTSQQMTLVHPALSC